VFEQEPKGEMETETLLHNPRLTLVAPHTLYIPPQSQQIIEAIDPGGPRTRQAFGMIERPQNCLLMEKGLATAHGYNYLSPQGTAKVAIMNCTKEIVTLRAGEPV
jgi:hypothetical protein